MAVDSTSRADTICRGFWATVDRLGATPAFHTADGETSWRSYGEGVAEYARALDAVGVRAGDRVMLLLSHRVEFHLIDMAALCIGAIPFSGYNIATAADLAHNVSDATPAVILTQESLIDHFDGVDLPDGVALLTVDGDNAWNPASLALRSDLDPRGTAEDVDAARLATIIYTSGTTGVPKGVQLSHRNIVALCDGLTQRSSLTSDMGVVSYLPMAHIAERLCSHYLHAMLGWTATICADPADLPAALAAATPNFFFAPPRLWEKLRVAVEAAAPDDRPDVVAKLGLHRVVCAFIGASPVPADLVRFWRSVGVPLVEEYGQSECTGVCAANPLDHVRIGSVGTALPGVELAIADDGEILVRGDIVMDGYRNLPERTADTIDSDGWLYTGDIGRLDEDGYLWIVDRKKELIINTMGKNMSPAKIESALVAASGLIALAAVQGNNRPHNAALLVLDPDATAAFAEKHGIAGEFADLTASTPVRDEVERAVGAANEQLSPVERVAHWRVLDHDWIPGGEQLTPTMKLRRKVIETMYAREIEELYAHR